MSRRIALLSLITVVCLGLPGAVASAASLEPVIASGRLLDAAGRPVAGNVELLAWPDVSNLELGQEVTLVPVASAAADPSGLFALRAAPTSQLAHVAEPNGGYVNLVLRATNDRTSGQQFFSRYLPAGVHPLSVETPWRNRPEEPATPLEVKLTQTPTQFRAASLRPQSPEICATKERLLERQNGIRTVVGELNTPPDTAYANWSYGRQADSDISVGFRSGGGPWAMQGSYHIGSSTGATVGKAGASSNYSARMITTFDYGRFQQYDACYPEQASEMVRAMSWRPSWAEEPHRQPGCRHDQRVSSNFDPDGFFNRETKRAVTWSGAANAFGADFSARSGYSQNVKAYWKFGRGVEHWLCGNNGDLSNDPRIYAG